MNTIDEIIGNLKSKLTKKKEKLSFKKNILNSNSDLTRKEEKQLKQTAFYKKNIREEKEQKRIKDRRIKLEDLEFLRQNRFLKKNNIEILRASSNYDEFKIYDPEFGIIQIGNDSSSKKVYPEHITKNNFNIASAIFLNNYPRDKKPFINDSLTFSDLLPIYKKFITNTKRPIIIADYLENTNYENLENIRKINNSLGIEHTINNILNITGNDPKENIFTNTNLKPISLDENDFYIIQNKDNEFFLDSKNEKERYKINLEKNGNIIVKRKNNNSYKTILNLNQQKRKNKYNSFRKVKSAIRKNIKENKSLQKIIDENIKKENTIIIAGGTGNASPSEQYSTDIIIAKGKKEKRRLIKEILRIDNYLNPIQLAAQTGFTPEQINTTYITHRHEDHIKGLIPTIYYNLTKSKKNKINLISSKQNFEFLKKNYENSLIRKDNTLELKNTVENLSKEYSQNKNNINIIEELQKIPIFRKERINKKEIKDKTKIKKNIFDIISFKTQHTVETYAPVIDTRNSGKIYITSDIDGSNQSLDQTIKLSKNSAITICDNGGTNGDPVHPNNDFVSILREKTDSVLLVNHLSDKANNKHIRLRQQVPYILKKKQETDNEKIFLRNEKIITKRKTKNGNPIINEKEYPARYNYLQKKELNLGKQLRFGNFFDYYFKNKDKILEDFTIELVENKKIYSINEVEKTIFEQTKKELEIKEKLKIVDKLEEIICDEKTMLNDDRKIDFLETLKPTIQNLSETNENHKLNIETLIHLDNMEELLRFYRNEIFESEINYGFNLNKHITETKSIIQQIKKDSNSTAVYAQEDYVNLNKLEDAINYIQKPIKEKKEFTIKHVQNSKKIINNLKKDVNLLASKIDKDYRIMYSFNELESFFDNIQNVIKYNKQINNIQERNNLYNKIQETMETIREVRTNQDRHEENLKNLVGKIYSTNQPNKEFSYLIYEPTN